MRPPALLHALETCGAQLGAEGNLAPVLHYGSPEDEARAIFTTGTIRERSARARLAVLGSEGKDLVNRLCTNDVKLVNASTSIRAAMTTAKGRIFDHVQIFEWGDEVGLLGSDGLGAALKEWFEKYIVMEDCTVEDRSDQVSSLLVIGEAGRQVVTKVMGASPAPGQATLPVTGAEFEGQPVHLLSTCCAGGSGVEVLAPVALAGELFSKLVAEGLQPVGELAYDQARVEAGEPALGQDIGEDCNPLEAGLKDSVSFTKGCYIGQEVVARLNSYAKVRRHLRGLRFPAGTDPAGLQEVFLENLRVGNVTSAVRSKRLNATVALAFLKSGYEKAGAKIEAMVQGERVEGVVEEVPFSAE